MKGAVRIVSNQDREALVDDIPVDVKRREVSHVAEELVVFPPLLNLAETFPRRAVQIE